MNKAILQQTLVSCRAYLEVSKRFENWPFFLFFFLNNSFECTNTSRINSHTLTTVQDYLHVIYYSNEDLLINCTILADWAHFIIHRLQDLNRIQGKKRAFDYRNQLTTGKIKRWNMLQKYLPIISAIKK